MFAFLWQKVSSNWHTFQSGEILHLQIYDLKMASVTNIWSLIIGLSQPSFLSNIFEKVVSNQLLNNLSSNNLFEPLQSAFRVNPPQKQCLQRWCLICYWLLTLRHHLLLLLDLSSAFNTVDHCILLERVQNYFGISGLTLRSYLSKSSKYNNVFSESCAVRHGVPQGSVSGPLWFWFTVKHASCPSKQIWYK